MSQVNHKSFREQLDSLDKMENHIYDVIVYTELKQKEDSLSLGEKHKVINLQKKINYEVDINQSDKRIKKVLVTMENYLYKCKRLVIAVDAGSRNIDESYKLIEDFSNEIDKVRQTEGKSALYEWSIWLLNKIKDLLAT